MPALGHSEEAVPERLLLDTCILNALYEHGEFVFDGHAEDGEDQDPDLRALACIFEVNQRAGFQLVTSPLTIAEIANIQGFRARGRFLTWALDVLDHWLIMVDDMGDRARDGGTFRHRFKLTPEAQDLERKLMTIGDFARDPIDRLLLVQYQLAGCDAFLTTDRNTIWKHRESLKRLDIRVLSPEEYWTLLRPWAALWI